MACVACSRGSGNPYQQQAGAFQIKNNDTGETIKMAFGQNGDKQAVAFQYKTGENGENGLLKKKKMKL